ncbi:ECF transporter S component [Moorellaceae bacterium AZ2]
MTGETKNAINYRYSTMDLLIIAVIAAVGGVVSAYVVGPWAKFIEGALGPFGAALDNPFFTFWGIVAGLLIGKPGVAFIASMLTGLIEVLAGSLDGSVVFVFVALQGLGAEIGLGLFRYRPVVWSALISGALAGVGCSITMLYVFGFVKLGPTIQLLYILTMGATGLIIAGGLSYLIMQGLMRAGIAGQLKGNRTYEKIE